MRRPDRAGRGALPVDGRQEGAGAHGAPGFSRSHASGPPGSILSPCRGRCGACSLEGVGRALGSAEGEHCMGEFLVKVRHLPGRSAITGSGTSPIAFVPGCPSGTPTSSAPAPTTMRSTKCCGS